MEKFIQQAEKEVRVINNADYKLRRGGCSLGGGRVVPFVAKTILHGPTPCFVYSVEQSIRFAKEPYVSFIESHAYRYAREKYGFKSETDYYEELIKREDYPSIEQVLTEVKKVAAVELYFNNFLENNDIEELNYEYCKSADEAYEVAVQNVVDKFYKEYNASL